jgi:hypothetical protein
MPTMSDKTETKLLFRIVQEHMVKDGRLTSSTFCPRANDNKHVSVYNGDYFSALTAFDHFTQKHEAVGVIHVTDKDCESIGLTVEEDNTPFQGHASIVYDEKTTNGVIKKKSAQLVAIVNAAGEWDYRHKT